MGKIRLLAITAVVALALVATLASCQQQVTASDQIAADEQQEIQEMLDMAAEEDAKMQQVAPGVWIYVHRGGVRLHMEPLLFTEETIPLFEAYVSSADLSRAASNESDLEAIRDRLESSLSMARSNWAIIKKLTPQQRKELLESLVDSAKPADIGGKARPAYLLNCTRANAMPTTAKPGAKAYAKGWCANAHNYAYTRAEAAGKVARDRDDGWGGAYASAVEYGNWSCSSEATASATVTISGHEVPVSSDSDTNNSCN